MPLVTVVAREHVAQRALLAGVADAVASALALGAGDVIATIVRASDTVVSGGASSDGWPIVSIHGSDRGAEAIARACTAAERAVRDWAERNAIELEGVWTEWLLPRPTP